MVAVPLRPGQPRVDLSTQLALDALAWGGALDILYLRSEGDKAHAVDLADKLTRARHVALMCNYDALLIVEADMLPPADALLLLAAGDYDIAYGTYCSRRGGHAWLVAQEVTNEHKLVLFPPDLLRAGGWLATQGIGTGFTLIRRAALEQITFRGGEWSPDWGLALCAAEGGLRQAHNLDVRCGHRVDERTVVRPDPAAESLVRIEESTRAWALTGTYKVAAGRAIGFSSGVVAHGGDIVPLADDVALTMLQHGTVIPQEER